MSMVVQHNITAMNANRMLGATSSAQAKSTEKLSSGYRINRAADDAAGLSISEKMRKQIRGLDRASTNAQDGISAVQTAEGALTEVHSMLQRMNELATQAANGTNSKTDRDSLQAEIDQLTTEIDRVAETTKFNETYLLRGNIEGKKSTQFVNAHDAGIDGKLGTSENGKTVFTLKEPLKAGSQIKVGNETLTIGESKTADDYQKLADLNKTKVQIGDSITKADGTTLNITNKATNDDLAAWINDTANTSGTGTLTLADGTSYTITKTAAAATSFTKVSNGVTSTGTGTAGTGKTFKDFVGETSALDLKGATFTDAAGNTFELEEKLNRDELTVFDKGTGTTVKVSTTGDLGTANETTISAVLNLASNGGTETTGGTQDIGELKVGDSVTTITKDDQGNNVETTKTAVNGTLAAATDGTVLEDGSKGAVLSFSDLSDKLNDLAVGAKIQVTAYDKDFAGTDHTEYTIAGSKDAETGNTLTVDSILSKIKEGDLIAFDDNKSTTAFELAAAKTYSVAGVNTEEGTTSVRDAYKAIAKELEIASSIGTDEGKGAKVTSNGDGSFVISQGTVEVRDALSFGLHVGADADLTNKISVGIETLDSASLGVKGIDISDETGVKATYAIDAIADAIEKVSAQRSSLGAVQNRLEHTIANLDNVVENTTSAESSIRDTDMATEMVNFSKNNILAQAGQSMLAQANQANQGVLSLLG